MVLQVIAHALVATLSVFLLRLSNSSVVCAIPDRHHQLRQTASIFFFMFSPYRQAVLPVTELSHTRVWIYNLESTRPYARPGVGPLYSAPAGQIARSRLFAQLSGRHTLALCIAITRGRGMVVCP